MNRYGQVRGDTADQTMPLEELLDYLQRSEHHQLTPLEAVAEQLEAMGDPTQPTREQGATLDGENDFSGGDKGLVCRKVWFIQRRHRIVFGRGKRLWNPPADVPEMIDFPAVCGQSDDEFIAV